MHGGDLEFSFSKMERDRVKLGLGYLAFVVLFSILFSSKVACSFEFVALLDIVIEEFWFFIIMVLVAGAIARLNGHWQRHLHIWHLKILLEHRHHCIVNLQQ